MQTDSFLGYEEISIKDVEISDILGIGSNGKYVFSGKYNDIPDQVIKLFPDVESREKELRNLINIATIREMPGFSQMIPTVVAPHVLSTSGRPGLVLSPECYPVEPCRGGCIVFGSDIAELVSLLEQVHLLGICHRDIKPSNIFKRKDNGKLYLNDWGSAASTGIYVPWEGTRGFYKMVDEIHQPSTHEDLIALARSAYLILYNDTSTMPVETAEIDMFWRGRFHDHSIIWEEIVEFCLQGNYQRLMELFPKLK
jgi:hypothetical protein